MLARDVMSKEIAFCTPLDTAQAAAKTMKARGIGALPVVSDAERRILQGIVTDRDLCSAVIAEARLAETTTIADVMTRNPVTCAPDNTLDDCERLMQAHQVRRLPRELARTVHRYDRPSGRRASCAGERGGEYPS
jgi:CBS domain-containing protein